MNEPAPVWTAAYSKIPNSPDITMLEAYKAGRLSTDALSDRDIWLRFREWYEDRCKEQIRYAHFASETDKQPTPRKEST